MIQLRRHTSQDYAGLPEIDLSNARFLAADDHACLNEIGRCLVEENAYERFGATLLHSHFPVEDDEILIEEANPDAQLITLRPVPDASRRLAATSVCFEDTGDPFSLIGLEFTSAEALADVRPLGPQDSDVLARLRGILDRHGKLGRFGVRLLHDPLGLDGRALLETCDPIGRVLTCRTTSEDDPSFADAVPTLFQWEPVRGHGYLTTSQGCMQFCKVMQKCVLSRSGRHQSSSSHETSHEKL